jgi:microcystin-dependent protein
MSDFFLGEIRIFAGTFAPAGWAICDGQLLSISQNTALFSLLGTYYGGDGRSTFALPNLQGMAPMGQFQGAGLSDRVIGEVGGEASVTLLSNQVPVHTHTYTAGAGGRGNVATVTGNVNASAPALTNIYGTSTDGTLMNASMIAAPASLPHENMQPFLVLNFIIALRGIFPSRN